MAYEGGSFDANLAAAAGHDPHLVHELRLAFLESTARQINLLSRSRCDGNWQVAAMRLKGLAASFHVEALMVLAEEAIEAAPGDPVVLRRLQKLLEELSFNS